jgi:hypothetical protein
MPTDSDTNTDLLDGNVIPIRLFVEMPATRLGDKVVLQ